MRTHQKEELITAELLADDGAVIDSDEEEGVMDPKPLHTLAKTTARVEHKDVGAITSRSKGRGEGGNGLTEEDLLEDILSADDRNLVKQVMDEDSMIVLPGTPQVAAGVSGGKGEGEGEHEGDSMGNTSVSIVVDTLKQEPEGEGGDGAGTGAPDGDTKEGEGKEDGEEEENGQISLFGKDGDPYQLVVGGDSPLTMGMCLMLAKDSTYQISIANLSTNVWYITLFVWGCAIGELQVAYMNDYRASVLGTFFKGLITCASLLQVKFLWSMYNTELAQKKNRNIVFEEFGIWSSALGRDFVVEAFVNMIHAFPFIDYIQSNHIFSASVATNANAPTDDDGSALVFPSSFNVLLLLRSYHFARYLRHSGAVLGKAGRLVVRVSEIRMTSSFTLRLMFKKHPLQTSLIAFVLVTLIHGYCAYILERQVDPEHYHIENTLWMTVIAMTTVGFGDVFPTTDGGRAITLSATFLGLLLTATLIHIVHGQVELSDAENQIVNFMEARRHQNLLKEEAARSIQYFLRAIVLRRQLQSEVIVLGKSKWITRYRMGANRRALLNTLLDFRRLRRLVIEDVETLELDQDAGRDEETLVDRIQALSTHLDEVEKGVQSRAKDRNDEFFALRDLVSRNYNMNEAMQGLMQEVFDHEAKCVEEDEAMQAEIDEHTSMLDEAVGNVEKLVQEIARKDRQK